MPTDEKVGLGYGLTYGFLTEWVGARDSHARAADDPATALENYAVMLQETGRDGSLLPKSVLMKDAPDEGLGRFSCRLVKVGVRKSVR